MALSYDDLTKDQKDNLHAWVAVVIDPDFDPALHSLSIELEKPWPSEF